VHVPLLVNELAGMQARHIVGRAFSAVSIRFL
jgi:hypothetical protein